LFHRKLARGGYRQFRTDIEKYLHRENQTPKEKGARVVIIDDNSLAGVYMITAISIKRERETMWYIRVEYIDNKEGETAKHNTHTHSMC
jgi:predicted phosphoribosyltransferase